MRTVCIERTSASVYSKTDTIDKVSDISIPAAWIRSGFIKTTTQPQKINHSLFINRLARRRKRNTLPKVAKICIMEIA